MLVIDLLYVFFATILPNAAKTIHHIDSNALLIADFIIHNIKDEYRLKNQIKKSGKKQMSFSNKDQIKVVVSGVH